VRGLIPLTLLIIYSNHVSLILKHFKGGKIIMIFISTDVCSRVKDSYMYKNDEVEYNWGFSEAYCSADWPECSCMRGMGIGITASERSSSINGFMECIKIVEQDNIFGPFFKTNVFTKNDGFPKSTDIYIGKIEKILIFKMMLESHGIKCFTFITHKELMDNKYSIIEKKIYRPRVWVKIQIINDIEEDSDYEKPKIDYDLKFGLTDTVDDKHVYHCSMRLDSDMNKSSIGDLVRIKLKMSFNKADNHYDHPIPNGHHLHIDIEFNDNECKKYLINWITIDICDQKDMYYVFKKLITELDERRFIF